MPMCQAFGCSNKVSEQIDKKFFSIPNPEKDRARCGAWLHAIGTDKHSLSSYKFSKHRVVCEDHFEKHCFMRDFEAEMGFRLPRKRLKPDAVPTIFVHRQMATTSRASSVRRAADGEISEMLSNLLHPPEDASAEASEGEATFHFVESSSIPSVNAYMEITTESNTTKAAGKTTVGQLSLKRKRRRRLSNRASSSSKEIATQTDLGHLVSSSTQTHSPEYYDGEAQEPPVQTDAPPDHSYCATEKDEEMVVIECDTHFLQTDEIEEEKVEKRVDETPVNVAEPAEKQSSSSHDESHPSDVSYYLESDDSSEDNEEREATKEEKCVHGRKFIVYEEALDILFYSLRCNQCFAPVQDVEKVNV
ncbi:hypothetical protein BSL78_16650 [Apostichopus japonicus]|uniref:THAP-type domain-containing protein n=1 Tax=Stichopus japonicus TaxID=307972 RepID=A0A2G8KEU1_STIJA|nr:hypothetical protein BSL78_16650 [Apostichopus japonicus]